MRGAATYSYNCMETVKAIFNRIYIIYVLKIANYKYLVIIKKSFFNLIHIRRQS